MSARPLTSFIKATAPNATAQAMAHILRTKTGFFQRCELVKMRAMLMGTSAPSQKVVTIMLFTSFSTATLKLLADALAGDNESDTFSVGVQDGFILCEHRAARKGTKGVKELSVRLWYLYSRPCFIYNVRRS